MAIIYLSLAKSDADLLETAAHINMIANETFQLQEEEGCLEELKKCICIVNMMIVSA